MIDGAIPRAPRDNVHNHCRVVYAAMGFVETQPFRMEKILNGPVEAREHYQFFLPPGYTWPTPWWNSAYMKSLPMGLLALAVSREHNR
jgi:hypothetical protein